MPPPVVIEELVSAGYWLGHPALAVPPRASDPRLQHLCAAGRCWAPGVFADLDAATAARALLGAGEFVHGLWLPASAVARVRREVRGQGLDALLSRGRPERPPAAAQRGHDVVGFGGALMLSFVREDAGRRLCAELGLPLEPPPFLPDVATARRLCRELEHDEFGAPVRWVRCWRTVHEVTG